MSIDRALDSFQKMKRDRMAFIVHELYDRGGKANLDEFKGSIATNYGIRGKTQDEYIKDLESAGMFYVRKNEIILKDKEKTKDWLKKQRRLPR